ncbi:hypothetical protein [Acaryochloris sp. IP29b_bin.137]|nr:hypothetical protein [Acaryochloris sp. IP29b_bin.137]
MGKGLELTSANYENCLEHLNTRIWQAQVKAVLAANQELILLYLTA